MKSNLQIFAAVILSFLTGQLRAGIIAGPITNPVNGHDFYLLTPNSWTAAEAEAEGMGGTLAIVRNDGEQKWIFSTFGKFCGTEHALWIGLHRRKPGGTFFWVDGSPLDFANWSAGEPNNASGNENCVHMQWDPASPGAWNDLNEGSQANAVVEMRGRTPKALTESERSLVGDWYENGQVDRPCHIAATDNTLFALNESNNASGRAFLTHNNFLFVASWAAHGEIVKDRILWSNGTWWSRERVEYLTSEKSETGHEQ